MTSRVILVLVLGIREMAVLFLHWKSNCMGSLPMGSRVTYGLGYVR
jgi:hypothetical protein